MIPRQGEVYWAFQDKKRPVVVVSRDAMNRGNYVLVAPLTTSHLGTRRDLPSCVYIKGVEYGLRDCVVQTELTTHLPLEDLDIKSGPVAVLDDPLIRDIVRAVGYVMDAECEPC